MAYTGQIQPNSSIILCADVPFDNTYQHTSYWKSASAQLSYYTGKGVITLSSYTYININDNTIRVNIEGTSASGIASTWSTIYTVNYMVFKNTNFENKYFYAFVTSIKYINNNVAELTFELDVLQTFFFDYELEYSWIERQHTMTDYIGANIQPEPLQITEYGVCEDYTAMGYDDLCIIVAICDVDEDSNNTILDNVMSGCQLYAYTADTTGVQLVNTLIDEYRQKENAIVNIYMCPKALVPSTNTGTYFTYGTGGSYYNKTIGYLTDSTEIGWGQINGARYTPKNCKLYTYPYTAFQVCDTDGHSMMLRYEFFADGKPRLAAFGCITSPVELTCVPLSYKGTSEPTSLTLGKRYFPESITLTNYPLCSWNYDAYQAWIAQNAIPLTINSIASLGQTAINLATTDIASQLVPKQTTADTMNLHANAGAASSLVSSVASMSSEIYSASIQADVCRGSFSNGGANISSGDKDIYYATISLDYYALERIDNFFTMFGYAINEYGKPNRCARDYWTYVKTAGVNLHGSIPAFYMNKIASIYDKGCTWWNGANSENFLDYSSDNRAEQRGHF